MPVRRRRPEPSAPGLRNGIGGIRVGVLDGYFARNAGRAARAAVAAVADGLASSAEVRTISLDAAEAGRAAAYVITNAESAAFHLDRLRRRAADFDPETRDRFLAGALLPAAWVTRAQRVRRWWLEQALAAFREVDLLLAPATPVPAPPIGARFLELGGRKLPLRPSLGLLAQPFSCIGLPVVTVPVFSAGEMPVGVQLVAAPWQEGLCLRAAACLEGDGVAVADHRVPSAA
jgi:1-carboxybiuret hydrolase